MGCCFSRSSGPNSPYPGGAPNASSRAINPPPLALPESVQGVPASSSVRRRRRDNRPLDQHIDKPLRRHEWTSRDRTWTKRDLARERADFFDTRVTGRPEIWQTVHAALEVLWDPTSEDAQDDGSHGLATAQMILSAAEISLPTGNLANGVYDSLGNYYQLPEWVVCDPRNVAEDHDGGAKGELSTAGEETTAEEEMSEDEEIARRKQEKGKEVIDVRERVTLRARLSENGKDVKISIGESESVRSVARKIAQDAGLEPTKKIRIAYMGKILKENSSLTAQGWQTDHVVNALVFNR
ncbi:Fc.00g070380.m01.CDS01 [Cosmosporella sp. VM-42]